MRESTCCAGTAEKIPRSALKANGAPEQMPGSMDAAAMLGETWKKPPSAIRLAVMKDKRVCKEMRETRRKKCLRANDR